MTIIRISRGAFSSEKYSEIKTKLDKTQHILLPAIKNLRGCLHFYAGIDSISNTIINTSVWTSIEDAKQMDTLTSMMEMADEFIQLGVKFDRPIINYDIIWEI